MHFLEVQEPGQPEAEEQAWCTEPAEPEEPAVQEQPEGQEPEQEQEQADLPDSRS